MDLRKLKTLIDLVQASGIAEIEINEEGDHVRIVNRPAQAAQFLTRTPPAQTPKSRTGDYRDPAGSSGPGRSCTLRSPCCSFCRSGL